MTQPTEPTAAQEQAQADADLAHAVAEEKLADDLAARDAEQAAVAEDEAALGQNPATTPEPPADAPSAASPAPVTNGLGDGDTSGGGGVAPTEPSSNAPTDVVTPGDTGADQPATAAPFDPSSGSGANAGAAVAPSQGEPTSTAEAPAPTEAEGTPGASA